MPQVGFEPMIPVFERAKTVHTCHRAATVIGTLTFTILKKEDKAVAVTGREGP
jgi:hypothetical protein